MNLWSAKRKNGFGGSPSARIRATVATLGAIGFFLILTPQPAAASTDKLLNPSEGVFPSLSATTETQPLNSTTQLDVQLRPRELSDSPMAPLPPALVAGPIGILLATWTAHRANRRGGKI